MRAGTLLARGCKAESLSYRGRISFRQEICGYLHAIRDICSLTVESDDGEQDRTLLGWGARAQTRVDLSIVIGFHIRSLAAATDLANWNDRGRAAPHIGDPRVVRAT